MRASSVSIRHEFAKGVWAPVPTYWGGGFWGSLAIGVTSAAVFGSIAASSNNTNVT
jgi:hypothetical protein